MTASVGGMLAGRDQRVRAVVACVVVLVILGLCMPSKARINQFLLSGGIEASVTNKRMVVYTMKDYPRLGLYTQGMMQDFFHVVGALKYGEAHGAAGVRVDFQTPMYSNRSGESYWEYFFEPTMDIQPGADAAPEVHFNGWFSRFGMLGSFAAVAYGDGRDDYHPFPYPHATCANCGIADLRGLVQKYIRLKPEWQAWIDGYTKTHFEGKYVIGVHYRYGDKAKEYSKQAHGMGMGCLDEYAEVLDRVISNVPEGQDYVIFVASDWKHAVGYFEERYGAGKVLSLEAPRINAAEALHKRGDVTPWEKGSSVVRDMLLLSKTAWLIRNRSSVTGVALLFNASPSPKYTYVIGNGELEHLEGDTIVHRGTAYPARGSRAVAHNPDADAEILRYGKC
eukprot:TRINITY_DN7642_c0_g2_i1.p2 TRINITY_DN7642_c0_g2~~TRINITY_DN7642_c0_g2_i1.p2  ORF type:complete len:394 (+),score=144.69 TRINITY_DN7642_c0_g2_i1:44-1225(+)